MPRLEDLAAFAEVARSLSYTRAADALSLSRPAVSKRIQALELEIGTALLKRSTRRVELTEAGAAFLAHVDLASSEITAGLDAARAAAGSVTGLVRISVPPSYGNTIVLPQVLAFLDRYPAVQVDVDLSDRPIDLIAERLDFALRITATPPAQASARRIAAIGWRLAASRRYLRSHSAPRRPADLREHRVLLPSAYRGRGSFAFSNGHTSEAVRIDAALSVTWTDSIARLVSADAGIALLPDYLPATDAERDAIVEVLPRWRLERGPAEELVALFLPGGRLRAAARALLDFLTPSADKPAWARRKPA
ncbi:MAG: LysR family transcriptional regulator [Betaproteobacteria bacterium]|jgi:DNA-binding transcriptional LysR family regulator